MNKNSKYKKIIASNIKKARQKLNLTQEALASLIFVSRSTIAKYEVGDLTPDKDIVSKLSLVLNIKESKLKISSLKQRKIFLIASISSLILVSSLVPIIHFSVFEHSQSSKGNTTLQNLNNELSAALLPQKDLSVADYKFKFNDVSKDEYNNFILNKYSSIEISNIAGLFTFEISYDVNEIVYYVIDNNYGNYNGNLSSIISENKIIYTFSITNSPLDSIPRGVTSIYITNYLDEPINIGKIRF